MDICEECSKPFDKVRKSKRFCSFPCQQKSWKRRQRSSDSTYPARKCPRCGTDFWSIPSDKREFCSTRCALAGETIQPPTIDPRYGDWLAGFIDGEGSFYLSKPNKNGHVQARFIIVLRDDDRAVLDDLRATTGLGTVVERSYSREGQNPTAAWTINSFTECIAFRDMLRNHPLRAKKRIDFEIWSAALDAWNRGDDHAILSDFSASLREARAYR